jgi:hypothetical protein
VLFRSIKPLFKQDLVTFKSNIQGSGDLKVHKTCLNLPKGILENRIITDDLNIKNDIKEGFSFLKKNSFSIFNIILIIISFIILIFFIFRIKKFYKI